MNQQHIESSGQKERTFSISDEPDRTLLITGGDGFIGKRILQHFFDQKINIVLLTLEKFRDQTESLVQTWEQQDHNANFYVVTGDITMPGLDLDGDVRETLMHRVTDVIHLAAAYDLSIDRTTADLINVNGTHNTYQLLRDFNKLERVAYMSTCAISGTFEGRFTEDHFDEGQSFLNEYERSKFHAERVVRNYMDEIPTIIFRPTVVVGDSQTGEIEKIDGPYYLFNMVSRRLHLVTQDSEGIDIHLVPVDFVADAFTTIMNERPGAIGTCVHLADPDPLTYNQFLDLTCERWGTFKPQLKFPPKTMEPLFTLPGAETVLGVPAESFPYSYKDVEYGTGRMEEILEGTGIECPSVEEYIDVMIDYYRKHFSSFSLKGERW